MLDFLDDLPVRTQFIVIALGLVVLFILVRLNTRYNKNKRLNRQKKDFGDRLRERRKEREENE